MNESAKKKANLINESVGDDILNAANTRQGSSNGNSSSNKEKKHRKGRSNGGGNYLTKLQNKIVELDPTYKPTGSMDQGTINKVMDLLQYGTKPKPTPTPADLGPVVSSSSSQTIE